MAMVSCSQAPQELTSLPHEGEAEYELHYSEDILGNGLTKRFLPRKVTCQFNESALKMSASAALGMLGCDVVITDTSSFVVCNIERTPMLLDIEQLFSADGKLGGMCDSITIDTLQTDIEMLGYRTNLVRADMCADGHQLHIEFHYIPVPDRNIHIVGTCLPPVPGLVTSVNICYGESNLIMLLTSIEGKKIDEHEFCRPDVFEKTSCAAIDSMVLSLM